MSVSPRNSTTPRRLRVRRSVLREQTAKAQASAPPQNHSRSSQEAKEVKLATRSRSLPPLLGMLLWVQRGSCAIAFSLIGTVLASYAATVYLQQQWSDAYRTLEKLQRETRNLTAADETLKHQLAEQAQNKEEGLTFPSPKQTIYLSPSTEETAEVPASPKPVPAGTQSTEAPSSSNVPLGY